ncbi:uncharacterized protein LOC143348150 [Colletes latitarsis]|uniref:uncharacterized protein LOC143348150 n=1 Tax=Colletes latitarsis TaxID=2605962 RepID=UPI0040357248
MSKNVFRAIMLEEMCRAMQELQTDSMDDEQALKTGNARTKGDKIRQDPLPTREKQKSDKTNSSLHLLKPYTKDKKMDTFEERNEQTIPTKDNFHIELGTNTSNINNAQLETIAKGGKVQTVVDQNVMQEMNELKEVYSTQDIPIKDKKMIERIQKDLLNERKRTEELEKKLESLTCSINCLKEDSEQKAACLKGALEMAEEQTKFAMDLVKRSKDQTDIIETDRNELLSEIAKLQQQMVEATHANTTLTQERDTLKNRLESLTEDEFKRY